MPPLPGPMIEEIIAICQTKEDQQTWVNDINKQISAAKQLSSSTSPSASTKAAPAHVFSSTHASNASAAAAPKPPPHAVSSIPYVHLSMYFARLVRKRVITRKVLKKLLYKEFFHRCDTEHVPRRRVHRAEYVIYPEKASVTWISSSSDSSAVGDVPGRLAVPQPSASRLSGCSSMADQESVGSERTSSFSYVCQPRRASKPVYRATLQVDGGDDGDVTYGSELKCGAPKLNLVCEDLSKMDDDTEMRYQLCDRYNFQRETCQSEPPPGERQSYLRPHSAAGFKSFSINCCSTTLRADVLAPAPSHDLSARLAADQQQQQPRYCSSYRISAPRASSSSSVDEPPIQRYHSTLNVDHVSDDGGRTVGELERCCVEQLAANDTSKLSLRSSDSGLADITSPFVNRQTRDPANTESGSSGNFETNGSYASPFDTTPYSSTSDDDKYAIEQRIETSADEPPATFKSGMYAHWWLKTKIPMSALQTSATSRFNSNTGKLSQHSHIQCVRVFCVGWCSFSFFFFFLINDFEN